MLDLYRFVLNNPHYQLTYSRNYQQMLYWNVCTLQKYDMHVPWKETKLSEFVVF